MIEECVVSAVGMQGSTGHDRYAALLELALSSVSRRVVVKSLRPEGACNWFSKWLWERAEGTKIEMSQGKEDKVGLRFGGLLMHFLGERIRENPLLTHFMSRSFMREVEKFSPSWFYGTHYLAFLSAFQGRSYFVPPDLYLHRAVGKMNSKTKLVSIGPSWDVQIRDRFNISYNRIIRTGFPLSKKLFDSIQGRLEAHRSSKRKILIPVGGSAPDSERYAIKKVLMDLGSAEEITILIGAPIDPRIDSIGIKQAFREELEQLVKEQGFKNVKIIGGVDSYTRQEELEAYASLISDPTLTHMITRPNESLIIGGALRCIVFMLPPFQDHEEYSYKLAQGPGFANVYRYYGPNFFNSIRFRSAHIDSNDYWIRVTNPNAFIAATAGHSV